MEHVNNYMYHTIQTMVKLKTLVKSLDLGLLTKEKPDNLKRKYTKRGTKETNKSIKKDLDILEQPPTKKQCQNSVEQQIEIDTSSC